MKYTKELVTGENINLKEFNLGIIKQPKVANFMSELDIIDFLKPFYMVRHWNNNDAFKEKELPFSIYYSLSQKNNALMLDLILYLIVLYDTKDIKLINCGDDGVKIHIKNKDGIESFIDDSNFNTLSKIILEILSYDEPKKEEKEPVKVGKLNEEPTKQESSIQGIDDIFVDEPETNNGKDENLNVQSDEDTYDLQKELEAKFDELFGPMDD